MRALERLLPFLLAALAVGLAPARDAAAGAWTKGFGGHYVKLSADFYRATGYVDPSTGEETDFSFFGQQYGLYGELGVFPPHPIQLSVQLPLSVGTTWFEVPGLGEQGTGHATTTRLGDLRAALQVAILHRAFQLAVAAELKLPLYANDSVGEEYGAYRIVFPLVGDGQVDLTGWVFLGGGLPGIPVWIEGGVGYRHRSERFVGWDTDLVFVDGIPFRATVGLDVHPLIVMAQLDGIRNLRDDEVTRQNLALGPAVMVTVWNGLAIEARFQGDLWARNVAQGFGFGVGVSWRARPPAPGADEVE